MPKLILLDIRDHPQMGATWHADFVGDTAVRELFGSTVLPTPFGASTEYVHVLREIQERNPDCAVMARTHQED